MVTTNYIIEGKCIKFCVHSSNDYLLVLSSSGYVFLFKVMTGELRGKIKVLGNTCTFDIDPSGLYLGVVGCVVEPK